ncbi:succinylglutamate desuccinylase/aspartoacylase family protein [Jiangella alkaliphila]|uniref:Succinylglutamate desuccinylase/Aspartoacylase catalytic domain-containing protein n=1 Tax=Jiangella alkaliphila TaxID=419479 RepID=A0A1H2K468_9ACTN|nr:succinylglutamate desuccinylase/aspartoacylase family protein [Jiangella alkaliphila]SDU63497.1 hypothetical protein SAMN04488563_3408 [Jiangella alkaliphila]
MQTTCVETVLAGGAVMTTVRGVVPGPTLALLGGVHGDEDEGVLAVRRLVTELREAPLVGTVRAVAPAHPAAWAAGSRTGPLDDGNLARCFPGDPAGGPTQALAAGITNEVIDGSDLLIDLHSAGSRYDMPLFCGFVARGGDAAGSERAAYAFGAPLVWAHSAVASGRTLSAAVDRAIPAVYVECAGGGGIRRHELDAYVDGVCAIMAEFGMLPPPYGRAGRPAPRRVVDGGDLDAGVVSGHDGFFVSTVTAGAVVAAGDEIGRIYSYAGVLADSVAAPSGGMVMFLRRQSRTRTGEVLFALAGLGGERGTR